MLVNVDSENVGPSQKPCLIACRCICCVSLLEPWRENDDDACRWLSVCRGVVIVVPHGRGQDRQWEASEWVDVGMAGENCCCNSGGGVDRSVGVCTDMDICTGDGVNVWCCWLI